MPTYEFRCPDGHEFEKFYRSISGAESEAACPICGKPSERRLSASGFAFKGSGFYLTDYGKNAHREKGTPTQASPATGDGAKGGESSKGDSQKGDSPKGDSAKSDSGSKSGESKPAASSDKPAAAPAKKSTE